MRIKTEAADVWKEYEAGKAYNTQIELYETVKKNENFYIGKQWEGLNAPDLDKPVLNFLKRVVAYFVSMIVTDDIGISIRPNRHSSASAAACEELKREVDNVIEEQKIIAKNRDALKYCAVDGDVAAYIFCEDGRAKFELVENTRVIFGNPYISEVEKQPYIIIVKPMMLEAAREAAGERGADADGITADYTDPCADEAEHAKQRVTVLVKFWKDKSTGTVKYTECTKDVILKPETDLGYSRYPIAFMVWDRVRESYHGQAAITGLIPNQIVVNKLWAMALRQQTTMAFPKLFYDATKIKNWSNKVGEAVKVTGNPNEAVATAFRGADMSAQVVEVVDRTINYTRDFMGASDAALGNIKPDNTSAIIAVQKASAAPLELQKLAFYQFIEDYVRIIIDVIKTDYPPRITQGVDENGYPVTETVDFSAIELEQGDITVDIGAAAYWSELTQIQTAENLYSKGIITDAETFLDSVPDAYIRNKAEILEKYRENRLMAQMGQAGMPSMGGAPIDAGGIGGLPYDMPGM